MEAMSAQSGKRLLKLPLSGNVILTVRINSRQTLSYIL